MAALIVDSVSVILFLFTGSLPLVLLATATAAYCFYLAIFVTKMDFFEDHVKVKKGRKVTDRPCSRITKVGILENGGISGLEAHHNVCFCVEGENREYKIPRNNIRLLREPPDSPRRTYDWLKQKTSAHESSIDQ